MVDVTHDRDDGRPQRQLATLGLFLFDDLALDRADLDVETELVTDELGFGRIEQVVHHAHDAELEQRLDHLTGLPAHLLGQLGDGH